MNRSRHIQWSLLLVLALYGASAFGVAPSMTVTHASGVALAADAPAAPAGVQRVASVEGITEYRLANGLRVLLFPDPSKQTVTVNITYLVGSRNEGYGEKGMAHLLEHLMFKGTPDHRNVPQELTEHGVRANGTTWFDRTNYYETFRAADANLEWALDLEADRMVNSFIARKDLDSEMTVVRNEFESGENNPVSIMVERTLSAAFLWHNYGNDTIGARSDIERVPIERLQAFYRSYYQPDNAVLLVAGKIDEPKTLALVQGKFGSIPRPTRVLPATYTSEPTQDGERSVTLRRVGDVQAVCAAYHVPAGSHPEFAAVDVLVRLLGDAPSGRLHRALVETKKASSVSSSGYQLREPGVVTFTAQVPKEKSLDEARSALMEAVEGMAAAPPTGEEVERARAQLLKQVELNLNASDRVGLELSEWIGMGDWRLLFLHRDRLRKVTPEDVRHVAAAYLKPSNRTVGLFIPTLKPDRAEIPPVPDVAAMLKDYHSDAPVSDGEEFDPSPKNIEARTTRLEPAGGVKLALLPKKTRGGMVSAVITLHFGDEKSLMNRATTGSLTGQMLMRGTARHTRQQLQDELDRLKARGSGFGRRGGGGGLVSGGAASARASFETTRENLPAVLQLVVEILREPSFPQAEFEQLKQQRLAAVEQFQSEPSFIATNALRRHLNPYPKGDVRYVATPAEEIAEIQAVTLDDLKKFHTEFYGASHVEMAVVGDFDDRAIAELAKELFGTWKSRAPYRRIPSVYHDVAAINQSFQTPDKANANFNAAISLKLRDDDPDYPALVVSNYLMGGGFLNSRLATRIRQKEGLSYGIRSLLAVDSLDPVASFQVSAISAPENAGRVEIAVKEEMARALKDGFTAEELAAAKSGYLQSQQVGRSQDSALAGRLASYLFLNRTLAWDADLEQRIQALTPEEIVAAMRKHIDPAKATIIKAGDFAKSAATTTGN